MHFDITTPYRRGEAGGLLRLDANEGAVPRAELLAALSRVTPELLRRYPDASMLEARIAARFDVDTDQVLVTAGGDDAIDRTIRALVGNGGRAALHAPTFSMTHRYLALAGSTERAVTWLEGVFPRGEFLEAAAGSDLAILTTPNNPTGAALSCAELVDLARSVAPTPVLIDLAYCEFDAQDPTAELLRLPHVLVVRTLSKAYGLAGLRVGYVLGAAKRVEMLRAQSSPFPVSSISLALAEKAVELGPDLEYLAAARAQRSELTSLLAAFGLRVLPSAANFVMALGEGATRVHDGLRELGIAVREFPGESAIRVTCPGVQGEFEQLRTALERLAGGREA